MLSNQSSNILFPLIHSVTTNGTSMTPTPLDLSWLPPGFNYTEPDPLDCLIRQRYQTYRIVIDIFIVGTLCVVGFMGNTLTILVLKTDSMNGTVSFLLQALAIADNCYLILCFFMQTLKAIYECTLWIPALQSFYPMIEPYVWALASMAQTTAVWIVVLLTTDRYFAICKPFNMGRFCTLSRAKKLVCMTVLLAVIYNIPRFFESQTVTWPDFCRNIVLHLNLGSKLRQSQIYFIVYKTGMYFVFRVLIPLGTLAVLNTRLIMTLRGARENRAILTKSRPKKNDSVTLVLVSVVTVFIICELPDFLLRIVVTVRAFVPFNASLHYINTITNMLLTFNSSINCLIYCLTGRRFRKVLKRLFFRTCSSPRQQFLVMDDATSENGTMRRYMRKTPLTTTLSSETNTYTACVLKEGCVLKESCI